MQEFKLRAQQQLNDQLFQQGSQLQMNEVKFNQQMQQLEFRDRMNHGIQNRIDDRDKLNREERNRHNTVIEQLNQEKFDYQKQRDEKLVDKQIKINTAATLKNLRSIPTSQQTDALKIFGEMRRFGIDDLPEGSYAQVNPLNGVVDIRTKSGQLHKQYHISQMYEFESQLAERKEATEQTKSIVKDKYNLYRKLATEYSAGETSSLYSKDPYTGRKTVSDTKKFISQASVKDWAVVMEEALTGNNLMLNFLEKHASSIPEVNQLNRETKANIYQVFSMYEGIDENNTIADIENKIINNVNMPQTRKNQLLSSLANWRAIQLATNASYVDNKPLIESGVSFTNSIPDLDTINFDDIIKSTN